MMATRDPGAVFTPGVDRDVRVGTLGREQELGYWRTPKGEVILGGAGPQHIKGNTMVGCTMLSKYGFWMSSAGPGGWDPNQDPFGPLLQSPGGIDEFSLEQIIELQWHRRPHPILQAAVERLLRSGQVEDERAALVAVMPQLARHDWREFKCDVCGKVYDAPEHVEDHQVAHREQTDRLRSAKELRSALEAVQEGNNAMLGPILQALIANQETQAQQTSALQTLMAALIENMQQQPSAAKPAAKSAKE